MATSIAISRVQRELAATAKETKREKEGGQTSFVEIQMINDGDFTVLKGVITGAEGTPYDGGKFDLEIKVEDNYPFQPPKVKFTTPIWHPNISSVTGAICLDVLKDKWAAALTIRTVLLSISAMMAKPEPDDPQDAVVAKQYKSDQSMFVKVAKFWTYKYANKEGQIRPSADQLEMDNKVSLLSNTVTKPTTQQKIVAALSQHNWNGDAAYMHLEDL